MIKQIFNGIEHIGLNCKPWKGVGHYFKFCSFRGQPVFCSYDITPMLHDIKLHQYAIITDQDDKLMYVFERGELKSF